jgi:hypothetical protein
MARFHEVIIISMNWLSSTDTTKEKDRRYCYHIHGYKECGYFRRGTNLIFFITEFFSGVQQGQLIKAKNSNVEVQVHAVPHEEWPKELEQLRLKYKSKPADMGTHKTSPAIWEGKQCHSDNNSHLNVSKTTRLHKQYNTSHTTHAISGHNSYYITSHTIQHTVQYQAQHLIPYNTQYNIRPNSTSNTISGTTHTI